MSAVPNLRSRSLGELLPLFKVTDAPTALEAELARRLEEAEDRIAELEDAVQDASGFVRNEMSNNKRAWERWGARLCVMLGGSE